MPRPRKLMPTVKGSDHHTQMHTQHLGSATRTCPGQRYTKPTAALSGSKADIRPRKSVTHLQINTYNMYPTDHRKHISPLHTSTPHLPLDGLKLRLRQQTHPSKQKWKKEVNNNQKSPRSSTPHPFPQTYHPRIHSTQSLHELTHHGQTQ
jgi:hypothetical protein